MSRAGIPTWSYAMVVVRLGRRFLIVRELKHGRPWYLPAGRVEPGERFADAALRETLEESGVPVTLEGVLRVEDSPAPDGSRMRVFFVARPTDDTPPKRVPDEHTMEARWVTVEELATLPMRGAEVEAVFRYVLAGGAVHPMGLFADEGAPWVAPG
jgi:ADP-ribose pyrophosphatase YjhB (NUDIX family)